MVFPLVKSTERGLQTIPGISYRSLSNLVNILAPNVSARQVRRRFESLNQTMSAHTVTLTLLSATTGKPISMPMTNVVSYMRDRDCCLNQYLVFHIVPICPCALLVRTSTLYAQSGYCERCGLHLDLGFTLLAVAIRAHIVSICLAHACAHKYCRR